MNMHFQEELPTARASHGTLVDWAAVKDELVANEGQWGLMAKAVAQSTPQQLRKGAYRAFRGEELAHFEFASRRPKNPENPEDYAGNRTDLWGRYSAKPVEK